MLELLNLGYIWYVEFALVLLNVYCLRKSTLLVKVTLLEFSVPLFKIKQEIVGTLETLE